MAKMAHPFPFHPDVSPHPDTKGGQSVGRLDEAVKMRCPSAPLSRNGMRVTGRARLDSAFAAGGGVLILV